MRRTSRPARAAFYEGRTRRQIYRQDQASDRTHRFFFGGSTIADADGGRLLLSAAYEAMSVFSRQDVAPTLDLAQARTGLPRGDDSRLMRIDEEEKRAEQAVVGRARQPSR